MGHVPKFDHLWDQAMTTHTFIFQVSHFDPNSGVGISAGGIASNQQVLQQENFAFFLPSINIFGHHTQDIFLSSCGNEKLSCDFWNICMLFLYFFRGFSRKTFEVSLYIFPLHADWSEPRLKFSLWWSPACLYLHLKLFNKFYLRMEGCQSKCCLYYGLLPNLLYFCIVTLQ